MTSSWLQYVASALVLGMTVYLFWTVHKISALEELPDEERSAKWPRVRDRMLVAVGFWQWCVAFVILAIPHGSSGAWTNTIALFLMGACLMAGPRLNRKINERFDGSRPS